ncbi:MAG: SF1B family DNA helicase RecD2 [Myxococcales bacterium]
MPGQNMEQAGTAGPLEEAVLEGTVERIVFQNAETQWTVARLQVDGETRPVTLVGELPGVTPGSSVRATGRWVEDRRYGRQFRMASFLPLDPSTLSGLERYLASGLVKGLGPALAGRIVKTFGLATLKTLDRDPHQLSSVPGLGKSKAKKLARAWGEQREARHALIFLQGHGVTPGIAARILKRYGPRAAELVRQNPYRLAADVAGIGFRTADRIAQSLGFAAESPERAEAGVAWALGELTLRGHVMVPRPRLIEEAARAMEVPPDGLRPAIDRLLERGQVVAEADDARGECLFPSELHAAEKLAAARLRAFARAPAARVVDPQLAFAAVEQKGLVQLSTQQKAALALALENKVAIVTGGPGVGKTTLVRGLLRLFTQHDRRVLLAAPTGRAAKRLSEASGHQAQTLHRLLEYSPKEAAFQRNAEHPLEADLIVVDEMSMVDIVLFHHLLEALPAPARLLLVGDADQLPSVGPGAVLRDLLRSRALPAVRLTEVFRQAAQSAIVQNAHRIHEGEMPRWDARDAGADFFFIDREEPEAAAETVCQLVKDRLPRRFGLDPWADIQVLTPMHRGAAGSHALNTVLQAALNPDGRPLDGRESGFRAGDKVMQLRNDYEREVFNGDIGRIGALDEAGGGLTVDFEGRAVAYPRDQLDQLQLAYACSVHKAQGSEYPAVVLPLVTQHYPMLQRNLLYTAVTRGKRLVVVVGNRRALALAVKNQRTEERFTRLSERLAL